MATSSLPAAAAGLVAVVGEAALHSGHAEGDSRATCLAGRPAELGSAGTAPRREGRWRSIEPDGVARRWGAGDAGGLPRPGGRRHRGVW